MEDILEASEAVQGPGPGVFPSELGLSSLLKWGRTVPGQAGRGPRGPGGLVPPPLCWPRTELGPCSQGAVQAGQLKVPPGYHPLDVEKEWGKLHVAILEREKQLRSEFERWVAAGRGWGLVVAGKPPEGESLLPREEIPPPGWETHTRARRQWAAGWRRGQKQEGARVLRPGAWRAVPSQRVPWVLGRRLECLQRIVSKLQMEAGLCEEQLNQADALLQSVRGRGRGGPAEAAGRRGGAGRIPEAASPGRRVAAPPSWCAASPD